MARSNIWKHPLTQVGLLLVGFRFIGLAHRYLILGGGGFFDRIGLFFATLVQHASVLAIVIGCFLLLWKSVAPFRFVTAACGSFAFFLLMILGQIDLTLSGITGATFTPTTLRTYRGPQLFVSKEFLEPMQENWLPASIAVMFFLAAIFWIVRLLWKIGRHPQLTPVAWKPILLIFPIAAAVTMIAPRIGLRAAADPVEVAFFKEYMGLDGITLRVSEDEAIAFFRDWTGLPAGAVWTSDQYPLVYTPPIGEGDRQPARPDIIVVLIESLRASDLGYILSAGAGATSNSPNLENLAEQSLVFPAYVSNGFPSAPAVIAFNCSAIPHPKKEIMTDFTDRAFDCIPPRLTDFGYETIFVGGNPGFDNQTHWFRQWFANITDLQTEGIGITDKNIVDRSISVIAAHDREAAGVPIFAFLSTVSLHYPFKKAFDDTSPDPGRLDKSLHDNYLQTLRYCDRHVGRLIDFLKERPRSKETIIIVTGDHGFYVDLKKTSGLPSNDNHWVSAIINGPESIVGPPRRDYRASSHVDMLPTITGIIGDRRPVATLGADLLKEPRKPGGWALVVRAGGFRMDLGADRLVVDIRAPDIAEFGPAIPELAASGEIDARGRFHGIDAQGVHDLVRTWAYLVEKDRIWDPGLLNRTAQQPVYRE